MDTRTTREKLDVLVYQCEKCGRPIIHTHCSNVFSKADVKGTAFIVSCPEKCKARSSWLESALHC
jgi:hypothetical protein